MNLAVEIYCYLSKTEKPMFVARFVIFFSVITVTTTVVAVGVVTGTQAVSAQSAEAIRVVSSGVVSEFPEGMRFTLELETDIRVDDVRVRLEVGNRGTSQYSYLKIDNTNRPLVKGELFHRTNSNDRYIPPGTTIRYWFEITDENGDSLLTEPETFRFEDARFEWEEVTLGPVTVLYHGPVRTRAESLAEAAIKSLDIMGPVTGADTDIPIVMTLYNNNAEMIGAVVARSLAASRELVTEGQAFDSEGVVLVLAGRSDIGTATHEMTHILVARAAGGSSGSVPLWLNEGLAEFGNLDQTVSYKRYLEWAIGTDRLTPLKILRSFPGDPNLTLVAYGQSRSVVEYMIETFGPAKMARLLSTLGTGMDIDASLETVYGFGIDGLEDRWREAIGAEPYIEATPGPTPTPVADPTPAYRLLTSPPESGKPTVEAGEQATPIPTEAVDPTAQADVPDSGEEVTGAGGTCSMPLPGHIDGTTGAWLLSVVGMVLGGRFRRGRRMRRTCHQ